MPDSPSGDPFDPFEDPFAPRAPEGGSEGRSPATASNGSAGAGADAPPLSRRAAREAAARGGASGPAPARPAPDPVSADDDAPWIFAAAAAAPALPYSRSGATPTVASAPTMVMAAASSTPGAPDDRRRPERSQNDPSEKPADARRSGASIDELFTGSTTTDDMGHAPPPKNKRRRRIGGWIALGVVLAVLGGLAAGGWYVWTTYEDKIRQVMGWEEPKDYAEGLANGEVYVTVAAGDTGEPISQSLYDAGVTMTPGAFYDYLIREGRNPVFQPGVYKLQEKMTSSAALAALLDPANKMELTAQIPEGFTVDGTLERLAEGTGIPLEEFQAAAADPAAYGVPAGSLEGWLFPATYTFDPGVTAQSAIQTLVDRAVQSLDAAGVPVEDRQRILTIASIIQREARYEQDMKKVSTVIQNRLDPSNQETYGLLQMDSTAQYGVGEDDGTVSSSEEALTDDNPWNTYVYPGLPVGPISNPGDVAINAAMNPEPGPWLYFVTVNLDTGDTVFTSTLAEHEAARQQWIAWCSENPDSGC